MAEDAKKTLLNNSNLVSTSTIWTKALADVAQWIEHQPANQRVASSIPSQGTCLGYRPGPQGGGAQETTTH